MDDNNVFREFYLDTSRVLYQHVRRMKDVGHLADDIVQETYYLAFRSWDTLNSHPNPFGWLVKASTYVANNMLSRKENEALSLEELEEVVELLGVSGDFERVELELMMSVYLSDKENGLLFSYYLEGYSTAEIAKRLSTTEENIRMRMSRARKKMKEKWDW